MKEFLDNASSAYYEGNPTISDEEFDRLASVYNYNSVGYVVTDGIPHLYKMYSLQKFFNLVDAPDLSGYISTPKLDGAAVSIVYVNGQLAIALTRGDGELGRDITDKMRLLVPNSIPLQATVQITGEVVCPSSVPNSRNLAAGSLNLKDLEEFRTRPLTFVAYGLQGSSIFTWSGAMKYLKAQGFQTVNSFDSSMYPTDGIVYRVDDNQKFDSLGYTSHHPRGAFALKEQKDGVVTTLLDVVWQVGKSGAISPVAILEPVMIGSAMVGRATLHNIQYIRDLNLEIGCQVEVIRSGEIIPRVVRRVNVGLPEEK
jgi:NAD-dependent DNA ligase